MAGWRFAGLLRHFSLSLKEVTELSDKLKTRQPLHFSSLLGADFQNLYSFDKGTLTRFTYAFFSNFQRSAQAESLNGTLQAVLARRYKALNFQSKTSIVKGIYHSRKEIEIDPKLLKAFVSDIDQKTRFQPKDESPSLNINEKLTLLCSVSLLVDAFADAQIEYEGFFKSFFKSLPIECFHKLSNEQFVKISEILANVGMRNKYFDVMLSNDESIYVLLERITNEKVSEGSLGINETYMALKCFVINDRGHEDFHRKLEDIVFNNLPKLRTIDFCRIPSFYYKRVLYDYLYLIQNVYSKIFHEFVNRFDDLDIESISFFMKQYWHNANHIGMYCDESLKLKLTGILNNETRINSIKDPLKSGFLLNILGYLNHSLENDSEIVAKIYSYIEKDYHQLPDSVKINYAVHFSRTPQAGEGFWHQFLKEIPKFAESTENGLLCFLYSISLNLQLQSPSNYEIIKESLLPYQEKLKEAWKTERFKDIKDSQGTFIHNEIEKQLKDRGVSFVKEYFDEYYLDIAIPKYKICLEIYGPGHYLFPSRSLNGRTNNKKLNLVALGWNYQEISFQRQRSTPSSITKFLDSILPLE